MADFIIKDIKIPDRRTIELMRAELACISRDECDRHCENCDLVQDVDELIVAFNEVIKFLETVTDAISLPEGHGNLIDVNAPIRVVHHDGTVHKTTPSRLLCKHSLLDLPKVIVPADVIDNCVGSKSEEGKTDDSKL